MKIIANILTRNLFKDSELYNIVSDKEKIIKCIPTLVVGWDLTKEQYPNASILDWKIDENTYWTFGNRERREIYEERVPTFRALAMNRLVKSIKYKYFNILTASDDEKVGFFKYIDENAGLETYLNADMAYIFNPTINNVTGISLRDIDYVGGNRKQFLAILYSNTKILNNANDDLSWNVKNGLRNYTYVIPCLCSSCSN